MRWISIEYQRHSHRRTEEPTLLEYEPVFYVLFYIFNLTCENKCSGNQIHRTLYVDLSQHGSWYSPVAFGARTTPAPMLVYFTVTLVNPMRIPEQFKIVWS